MPFVWVWIDFTIVDTTFIHKGKLSLLGIYWQTFSKESFSILLYVKNSDSMVVAAPMMIRVTSRRLVYCLVKPSPLTRMHVSWFSLLFLLSFSSPLKAEFDNVTLMVLSTTPNYTNMSNSSGALLLRNNTDPLEDVTFCWRFIQFRIVNTFTMIISAASDEGILLQFYVVASELTHFYRFFSRT